MSFASALDTLFQAIQRAARLDGTAPDKIGDERFALSAWGTFSTRFAPFAAHIDTVTTATVPADWARANATIYVTYPLHAQIAVGPLAAALVAGLTRHLLARPQGTRTLMAIDEMPTVALPHLTSTLATVGGAGMTLVLYAQSVPQIEATYGHEEALSISRTARARSTSRRATHTPRKYLGQLRRRSRCFSRRVAKLPEMIRLFVWHDKPQVTADQRQPARTSHRHTSLLGIPPAGRVLTLYSI